MGCCSGGYWDKTNTWISDDLYHFSNIPAGTEIDLLAISKINDEYYYSKINTTISGNDPHVEDMQMIPTTYSKLTTLIDDL